MTPGPGQYEFDSSSLSKRNKSPAYSIKGKPLVTSLLIQNDPKIPGPGKYDAISLDRTGRYFVSKF